MIKIKDILTFLQNKNIEFVFRGNSDDEINGFSSLYNYKEGTITWCKDIAFLTKAYEEIPYKLLVINSSNKDYGICDNCIDTPTPKKAFFSILEAFFKSMDELPDIGQGTYVSKKVKLGKNVKIGYNCVLDGDITIEDGTVVYNNVVIINKAKIGKRCIIHSGVTIGHDCYAYTEDCEHNKTMLKHYGGVEIGDDVFIGVNCIIARGTIDDTVIGSGSKLDAQCHISHNVVLGQKSALISGTKLYGSVKTGENAYIVSAMVKNQVEVGNNVTAGMGSVVLQNLEDNMTVVGIPAKPIGNKK